MIVERKDLEEKRKPDSLSSSSHGLSFLNVHMYIRTFVHMDILL